MPVMPVKWEVDCKVCGRRIQVGETAQGAPTDAVSHNGKKKWDFICSSCSASAGVIWRGSASTPVIMEDSRPEVPQHVLDLLGSVFNEVESKRVPNPEPRGLPKAPPLPAGAPIPPVGPEMYSTKWIQQNAPWSRI